MCQRDCPAGDAVIDDRYRVKDMSEDYGSFELTTVDGVRCLLVTLREDHTDASIRDHFLLISLKDMENIRGVRSEGPYANNMVRMNYTDYISGGENTKEESLNTVSGGAGKNTSLTKLQIITKLYSILSN